MDSNHLHHVRVGLDAAYLLHTPESVSHRTLLILTLHGYGSNPEAMLRLSVAAAGEDAIVASLRAPNQYYASGSPTTEEVAYNWGTRRHGDLNIRLHHEIVSAAAADLRARFLIDVRRTILMGFSQPVGLNYRFIGTYPDQAGGVIAICGGVPKNWEDGPYHPVSAPILHISRSEDEFFPTEVVRGYPDRLRKHARDVEFHLLPGGHRFPSKARPIIQAWRERVFPWFPADDPTADSR